MVESQNVTKMGGWLKDEGVKRGKCEGVFEAIQREKGGFWRFVEGRIRSKVGAKRVIFAPIEGLLSLCVGLSLSLWATIKGKGLKSHRRQEQRQRPKD